MAEIIASVTSYQLRLQSNAPSNNTRGQIRILAKNNATGATVEVHYYFRKAGITLSAPTRSTNSGALLILADQPESFFGAYVDALRNEKPLTVVISDNNDTMLHSNYEAVGAHEIGA